MAAMSVARQKREGWRLAREPNSKWGRGSVHIVKSGATPNGWYHHGLCGVHVGGNLIPYSALKDDRTVDCRSCIKIAEV